MLSMAVACVSSVFVTLPMCDTRTTPLQNDAVKIASTIPRTGGASTSQVIGLLKPAINSRIRWELNRLAGSLALVRR